MTTPLPTPRCLLTSILKSLTTPPPATSMQSTTATTTNPAYDPNPPPNPLSLLPAPHRALLTTLHVLFPPPTLLQALDLLDRNLVTRLILSSPQPATTTSLPPPQAPSHLPVPLVHEDEEVNKEQKKEGMNRVYLVRSSQAPKGRFKNVGSTSSSAMAYTVRLEAWNCSCAAFAFSAFPGSAGPRSWAGIADDEQVGDRDVDVDLDVDMDVREKSGEWQFGGLTFDGREGGSVPVCKHLLACVLGEYWGDVLGGYVREKEVGRDEMAGFGGEG